MLKFTLQPIHEVQLQVSQLPSCWVQVSLQIHPYVVPHPFEEGGLQAGPDQTKLWAPYFQNCTFGWWELLSPSSGRRDRIVISCMRTPLVETLRRTLIMEIFTIIVNLQEVLFKKPVGAEPHSSTTRSRSCTSCCHPCVRSNRQREHSSLCSDTTFESAR